MESYRSLQSLSEDDSIVFIVHSDFSDRLGGYSSFSTAFGGHISNRDKAD
jgi:hypothetical protein